MNEMDSVSNLVIGNKGQIGSAIQKILECDGVDIEPTYGELKDYNVLHICIPYSQEFSHEIIKYKNVYASTLIIIHSTVPVGTCEKFDFDIVYSPCRGIHPELEEGIRTFKKYFAGKRSQEAGRIFSAKGINVSYSTDLTAIRSLEAAKLWDTTIYGLNILIEKEIYSYCEKNNLDFNLIYTKFNETYNEGYEDLNHPEFKKYVLQHMEGEIGGHCIVPNAQLLDSPLAKLLCPNTKN